MKPFNRINNLSLKNLQTIYIWKIGGDKPKLYRVCASINGARMFIKSDLNILVSFALKPYIDTMIPIENTLLVTSDLKWKTEEFVEQMKYLKKK